MKIRKTFLLLISTLVITSTTAYAEQKDLIQVTHDFVADTNVLPGDTWSDSFTVTNQTDSTVKVRIDKLENINNSELYNTLDVIYSGETYYDLNKLSSDWVELKKNESKTFDLSFYFSKEAKNEYQDKTFSARLFFQCEAPENSSVDSNGNIVQTGDDSNMLLYIIPLGVSLIALIIVFIIRRKRHK